MQAIAESIGNELPAEDTSEPDKTDSSVGRTTEIYADTDSMAAAHEDQWQEFCKIKDGGGLWSTADWLSRTPSCGASNQFAQLRRELFGYLSQGRFLARLLARSEAPCANPFFSPEECDHLRDLTVNFLISKGYQGCADIPDGQPYCLYFLQDFADLAGDEDGKAVLEELLAGVRTGTDEAVPHSEAWPSVPVHDGFDELEYLCCEGNWRSAETEKDLVLQLLEEEVKAGHVFELGSLEEAKLRWPGKVAVGKLGLVKRPGKEPRLTGDSTVCNVNNKARFSNKMENPGVKDVQRVFERRAAAALGEEDLYAMAVDVKGAHKTIRLRESEQGKCIFSIQVGSRTRFFAYKVCHFGGKFSAYWWGRFGGFLVRLLHKVLRLPHAAWLYVDDLLICFKRKVGPLCAIFVLALFAIFGIPVSWPKLQLGHCLEWIGFAWNLGRELKVTVPEGKRLAMSEKLLDFVKEGSVVRREDLRSLAGLLVWFCNAAQLLRPWLCEFYRVLRKPQRKPVMMSEGQIIELLESLDNDLYVLKDCRTSDVQKFWRLRAVSSQDVFSKQDLCSPRFKHGKAWLLFLVFDSEEVEVDHDLAAVACMFRSAIISGRQWSLSGNVSRQTWAAAADAYADASGAGIGGWWSVSGSWPTRPEELVWFSCSVSMKDLPKRWQVKDNLQKLIATLEAVAQWVLLHLRCREGGLCQVELRQWGDNEGVMHAHNKLFTTKVPLCYALQGIAWTSACHGVTVDVCHRSGRRNVFADQLSRLDDIKNAEFKSLLLAEHRRHVDLGELLDAPCSKIHLAMPGRKE